MRRDEGGLLRPDESDADREHESNVVFGLHKQRVELLAEKRSLELRLTEPGFETDERKATRTRLEQVKEALEDIAGLIASYG